MATNPYVGSFVNEQGRKINYDATGKHYDSGNGAYDPSAMSNDQQSQYSQYSRGKMNDWMTANGQPYMVSGGAGEPSRESMGIANESDWLKQNNQTAGSPEWDNHVAFQKNTSQWDAQLKASDAAQQAQRTANGWGPQTSGANLVSGPAANLGMGGGTTDNTAAIGYVGSAVSNGTASYGEGLTPGMRDAAKYLQPQGAQQPSQPTMQNMGQPAQQPSSNLGMGRNPYLQQVGQALTAQSNQNLQQNVLPGIGQGAQAAGMYGSSRQGTAEGIAMGNAQTGLNSALANMYSQGYGQDQQYDLGLRNNNLGFANLDSNNAQFGANFGLQSQNYQNQWANNNVNAANQMAQTPWNQFNQSAGLANGIAGQGGSTSQTNQGNPWLGGLGGMQLGQQLFGKP